jgi:hypothetical protein
LVSHTRFKKRRRKYFEKYKYFYFELQLLEVMVKKRSNYIVLKATLNFEKVKIIVNFKANKSYALIRLAEKFKVKKK